MVKVSSVPSVPSCQLVSILEMTNIVYSNRGSRRVIVGRSKIDSSSELGTLGTDLTLTLATLLQGNAASSNQMLIIKAIGMQ